MDDNIRKKFDELKEIAQKLGKDPAEVLQYTSDYFNQDKQKENKKKEYHQKNDSFDDIADKIWKKVQIARHQDRPTSIEYIDMISEQYMELHGDRYYGDDKALIGGICTIDGVHFTFLAHQKGKNMKENILCHYGMAHPEGYRKALRLAKQAEKFARPIITFIDTPGAYPGLQSEERGIGEAIAKNLMELSVLRTPIICIVIGEGGSGGALGIGVGDKVYMLENSIYSVISPEGFASILLRDSSKAKEAATYMKLTSEEILQFRLIDGIIPEPTGGAHNAPIVMGDNIKNIIMKAYAETSSKDIQSLVAQRSQKIIDHTRISENILEGKDLLSRIKNFFKG